MKQVIVCTLSVFLFGVSVCIISCKKKDVLGAGTVPSPNPPPPQPPQTTVAPCNWPVINATLTPVGNLSTARIKMQCATAGNKILFIGGWHTGQNWWNEDVPVDIYDFSTNTWSIHFLVPADPQFTHFRFGAGVVSVENKVFIGGGGDAFGDNQSSRVDIYDASTDTWTAQQLSVDRQDLVAAAVGDKVLFAGGYGYPFGNSSWGVFSTVDIYNNTTNSWTTANLSQGRMGINATTFGNKIYFAGGSDGLNISKTVDIYDALTNSWSKTSLTNPRMGMGVISYGDEIFFAGGAQSFTNSYWSDNNNVEILNPNTGVTTMTCFTARRNLTAVQKGENIVFFTGDVNDGSSGSDFEIYNTANKTWSIGRLQQKIFNAAIISVNNAIYVAGGTNGNTYLNQLWKLEF